MKGLLDGVSARTRRAPAACAQAQEDLVTVAAMREGRVEVDGKAASDPKGARLNAGPGRIIASSREDAATEPTEALLGAFMTWVEIAQALQTQMRLSSTRDSLSVGRDHRRIVALRYGS